MRIILSSVLLAGVFLAGCNDTAPVGGQGYFDAPMPNVNAVSNDPISLVPVDPAPTGDLDMTESLTSAVNDAIDASEIPTDTPAETVADAGSTISTDDGTLNLNITSQAQQLIERTEAARILAEARERLVIIEPGTLPTIVAGVNIAEFARNTTNEVGEKLYRRPIIKNRFSQTECRKFSSPDDAQRYFLANAGPERDPLNLDPDGDGFACRWTPEFYRLLQ